MSGTTLGHQGKEGGGPQRFRLLEVTLDDNKCVFFFLENITNVVTILIMESTREWEAGRRGRDNRKKGSGKQEVRKGEACAH